MHMALALGRQRNRSCSSTSIWTRMARRHLRSRGAPTHRLRLAHRLLPRTAASEVLRPPPIHSGRPHLRHRSTLRTPRHLLGLPHRPRHPSASHQSPITTLVGSPLVPQQAAPRHPSRARSPTSVHRRARPLRARSTRLRSCLVLLRPARRPASLQTCPKPGAMSARGGSSHFLSRGNPGRRARLGTPLRSFMDVNETCYRRYWSLFVIRMVCSDFTFQEVVAHERSIDLMTRYLSMRPPVFPLGLLLPQATIIYRGNPFVSALGPTSTTSHGPCYGIHIDAFLHERLDICCMHSGHAAQRAAGAEDYMEDDHDHSTGIHHHHQLDNGPLRQQRSPQHVTRTFSSRLVYLKDNTLFKSSTHHFTSHPSRTQRGYSFCCIKSKSFASTSSRNRHHMSHRQEKPYGNLWLGEV